MADKTTPAFPIHEHHIATGLTMRDWFAGKAMQVYLQNTNSTIDDDAKHAYAMADAMLRAREANQ